MYNDHDSEAVLAKVQMAVFEWSRNPKAEPEPLRYRDLVQILLRFQMELTQGFLADFVHVFATVDLDEDGIVDQRQLFLILNGLVADLDLDRAPEESVSALQNAQSGAEEQIRRFQFATFS